MNAWFGTLVDNSIQCWGCPIFDRLFQVISVAAANVYKQFSLICILIFCIILAFYALYAVWDNLSKNKAKDMMYQEYIKPVLINSLFVFALLGLGVQLPRFITTIAFEPVADIAIGYTQTLVNINTETVEKKIDYKPMEMTDDGFFRPQLRDKIILLMKTTITQFQSYIKLGIAIMDNAFSWTAMLGIGDLIKHILMFIVGLYLTFNFFKIFIKFCFYFIDIIIAMTLFAFFFPLSLIMFAFKNSKAPDWVKDYGAKLGVGQFKKVINAIVGLAAAIMTYTVIMIIIAKFFSGSGTSSTELMGLITSGEIYAGALSNDNLAALTIMGAIVLVYLINYLESEIKNITTNILKSFNVEADNKIGEEMGENILKLSGAMIKTATDIGKTIINPDAKDGEKSDAKPDAKSDAKKDGDK